MNKIGRIVAISISSKKGIPKSNVDSAVMIENYGIKGDAHAGDWHRQISLLAQESIDRMKDKGLSNLHPGIFAENLTTEFINLPEIKIGTKLKIRNECELEITQIGKECHNRCAIYESAGNCIMPDEGVFARVVKGGEINVNDIIEVLVDE